MARGRTQRSPSPWLALLLFIILFLLWRFVFPTSGPGLGPSTGSGGPCGDKFAYGQPQAQTGDHTTFLCRSQYAALHDDRRLVPLYSAERLVGRDLERDIARTEDFRPDDELPPGQRAELADYRGSGFDRGHMTPAADSDTEREMSQSFLLSNMVPQNGIMNSGIWSGLESATRACAQSVGQVFVLTGPVFGGSPRTVGPDGVEVPDELYKIVLDARNGDFRAFLMPNRALRRTSNFSRYEVPIGEVEQATHLRFFPNGKVDASTRGALCPDAYGS